MSRGWCVRVSVNDELVVSLSDREVAGRDLSEADVEVIRACAQHLLAFVGPPTPQLCACLDYAAGRDPAQPGICPECGRWYPATPQAVDD